MRSFSSVMRRVFEGGVGCESGGSLERSMDSEGRDEPFDFFEGEEARG